MPELHVIAYLNDIELKWTIIDYFIKLGYDCSAEKQMLNSKLHDFWFYEYNPKQNKINVFEIEKYLRKSLNTSQVFVAPINAG